MTNRTSQPGFVDPEPESTGEAMSTLGWTRTNDFQLRKLALYSTELRGHFVLSNFYILSHYQGGWYERENR